MRRRALLGEGVPCLERVTMPQSHRRVRRVEERRTQPGQGLCEPRANAISAPSGYVRSKVPLVKARVTRAPRGTSLFSSPGLNRASKAWSLSLSTRTLIVTDCALAPPADTNASTSTLIRNPTDFSFFHIPMATANLTDADSSRTHAVYPSLRPRGPVRHISSGRNVHNA